MDINCSRCIHTDCTKGFGAVVCKSLALSSPVENKPTSSSVGLNKVTLVKGWRAPASWLNSREGAVSYTK